MVARKAICGVKRLKTASLQFSPHDTEIDLWRAANLMLKRYGDTALVAAEVRRRKAGVIVPDAAGMR